MLENRYQNQWEGPDWKIKSDYWKNSLFSNLELWFHIFNEKNSDFRFDLAFYIPINYGSKNKNADLYLIENGDVVDVDGADKHIYFHLKKNPWSMHNPYYDYLCNVDSIYMGSKPSDVQSILDTQKEQNYT